MKPGFRSLRARHCVLLGIVSSAGLIAAQGGWLPPQVQAGLSQQLADRMAAADGATSADHLPVAQSVVATARARLDAWGEAGTLERVPSVAYLNLPAHEQRHLDAMRRIFVCISLMEVRAARVQAADGAGPQAIALAVGSAGLTLSVAMLRHHFLLAGGDPSAIEGAVTGGGMDAVVEGLQNDGALLTRTSNDCNPLVRALLTP